MSRDLLDGEIESVVHDLSLVMARCNRIGLETVASRLEPIRDIIAHGLKLRRLANAPTPPGGDDGRS